MWNEQGEKIKETEEEVKEKKKGERTVECLEDRKEEGRMFHDCFKCIRVKRHIYFNIFNYICIVSKAWAK